MKIPPLPDTDLARFAPMPPAQRRAALEAFRISHPPYRYKPVRKSFCDILNVQSGFLPIRARAPFARIEEMIRAEARSEDELAANLRVASALYEHAVETDLHGRSHELFPMTFSAGAKLVYWHSMVLGIDGQPLIPFIDPRRTTTRLSFEARRFVFSVMHERIRAADRDYEEVRLGIYQFTAPEKGPRRTRLHTDEGVTLFTFEELEALVRETYETWTDVYMRRTEERRRSGVGAGGLF